MIKILIRLIKKMFAGFGYEIHKFTLRNTMGDVHQHVVSLGFKPATVIDVGVAWGTSDLYQTFPDAFIMLIEPLSEFEPNLKQIVSTYRSDFIISATGETEGSCVFNVHPDLSGSSLLSDFDGVSRDGVPRNNQVTPIDSVVSKRSIKGPLSD